MNPRPSLLLFVSIFSAGALFAGCSANELEPLNPGSGTGGDAATGGATAGLGGTTAPGMPPSDENFELVFRDDFDSLDATRWQLMTHSWPGNLAHFSPTAVKVENGEMTISLLAAPEGTMSDGGLKPYLGAEVRSKDAITYGRVRARAKFAKGSAVVSSLVTIYTPWPADNWNELDIECLGQAPDEVQYNAMVYTGPELTPPVTTSVRPTQDPLKKPLGFDASEEFHEYTIEWTPAGATFSVDGAVQRRWTKNIDLMTLPQNVLLTIWASDSPAWAGAVGADTEGAHAVYDWIEVSQWNE